MPDPGSDARVRIQVFEGGPNLSLHRSKLGTKTRSNYDAAYLELAMRRGLLLATLDGRLRTAALAVWVSSFARRGAPHKG
ncbi:type II toxin-antitoxin system VapC family toxin [Isosphaeraceae bacterium EP7]